MTETTATRTHVRRCRTAYARIAGQWERDPGSWDEALHVACRQVFLEHLPGRRVLDAGCGLGRDSAAFGDAGLEVTAIDQVQDFARVARAGHPRVCAIVMDLTALAFRPSAFDGVFAGASLLHVPGSLTASVLAGLRATLVPGGVLFVSHVASSLGLRSYTIERLLIDGNSAEAWCHTETEMAQLLEGAGFAVTGVTHLAPARPPSAMARQHGLVPYQIVARAR